MERSTQGSIAELNIRLHVSAFGIYESLPLKVSHVLALCRYHSLIEHGLIQRLSCRFLSWRLSGFLLLFWGAALHAEEPKQECLGPHSHESCTPSAFAIPGYRRFTMEIPSYRPWLNAP